MPNSSTPCFDMSVLFVVSKENMMTWRVVHVNQSEKMRLKLDNIVIKTLGEEYTIPLSDISIIVAEGGDTVV